MSSTNRLGRGEQNRTGLCVDIRAARATGWA